MNNRIVVAIDFDNTIVEWVDSENCVLKKGAKSAIKLLKSRGCYIVVNTCRVGIAKNLGTLDSEIEFIKDILDRFDVPYDSIHLGTKVVADAYIDDRAIPFKDNWESVASEAIKLLFEK